MNRQSNVHRLQKAFNAFLDENPDFPWSICDAAAAKALEIAVDAGIPAEAVHFDPTRLKDVTWPDMNPNHVWLRVGAWFFDPKHGDVYPVAGPHPYQPARLIRPVKLGNPRSKLAHRAHRSNLAGALAFRGLRPTRQETAHTCGPASLQCVAAFTGRRLTEAAIAKALGTTKRHGTTPAQLMAGAQALALHPTLHRRMGLVAVLMALKRGRPTIVLWDDGGAHWSVVVGVHAERRSLVLADPWRKSGMRLIRFAAFKRSWRARVAGRRYVGLGIVCRP